MIGALWFLRWHSLRNRVRVRLRRLREPKYLAGGIVGLLYLWVVFFRNLAGGPMGLEGPVPGLVPTAEMEGWLEWAGAWLTGFLLAAAWVLPTRRGPLEFSEAEIQFLFPAPVSRRGLLHYKLASWQLGFLFASLTISLFTGRLFRGGTAWMSVVGWWLWLFVLQLHALGASFIRARLLDRGFPGWGRQVVVAVVGVTFLVATVVWGWNRWPPLPSFEDGEPEVWREWFGAVSTSAPASWLVGWLRPMVRLVITRDPAVFLASLPIVLGWVGLHYAWVIRSTLAFEEAAVEAARSAAERRAAGRTRSSNSAPRRVGRTSCLIPLGADGPAWVALTWKNLLAAGNLFRGRGMAVVLASCLPAVWVASRVVQDPGTAGVVGGMAVMLLGVSMLAGPAAARLDLRLDLATSGDILKSLPLSGWQVVLGEILAPWALLTAGQWFLALLAVVFLPGWPGVEEFAWGFRWVAWLSAAVVVPAVTGLGLCLHNAAALLFPAWILRARGLERGGLEVMGQQLIVMAGQMLALVAALVPAGLAGAVVFAAVSWLGGPGWAVLPAAVAAALILLLEGALVVVGLGWVWDRSDPAREWSN